MTIDLTGPEAVVQVREKIGKTMGSRPEYSALETNQAKEARALSDKLDRDRSNAREETRSSLAALRAGMGETVTVPGIPSRLSVDTSSGDTVIRNLDGDGIDPGAWANVPTRLKFDLANGETEAGIPE